MNVMRSALCFAVVMGAVGCDGGSAQQVTQNALDAAPAVRAAGVDTYRVTSPSTVELLRSGAVVGSITVQAKGVTREVEVAINDELIQTTTEPTANETEFALSSSMKTTPMLTDPALAAFFASWQVTFVEAQRAPADRLTTSTDGWCGGTCVTPPVNSPVEYCSCVQSGQYSITWQGIYLPRACTTTSYDLVYAVRTCTSCNSGCTSSSLSTACANDCGGYGE